MEAVKNESTTDDKLRAAVFAGSADLQQLQTCFARLGRQLLITQQGGIDEALDWCAKNKAPGLLFVDIAGEQFALSKLADLAASTGPSCRIVALGTSSDVNLYRALLLAGLFDYVVSPLSDMQIAEILHRADTDRWLGLPESGGIRLGQTMAISGVSGGVGTSTLVTLLGRIFAEKFNIQTLLVDFDRQKADLGLLLGVTPDNGLAGILNASQIDYRLIARSILSVPNSEKKEESRLNLLAQRPGREEVVQPELLLELGAALCELFSLSIWDIPSYRPSGGTEILIHSDICVLTFDYTLSQVRALKLLLSELGEAAPGQRRFLVANASRNSSGKPVLSRAQVESFLGTEIDFELPYAGQSLDRSLLEGPLTARAEPEFAKTLESVANALLGRQSSVEETRGSRFSMRRFFK